MHYAELRTHVKYQTNITNSETFSIFLFIFSVLLTFSLTIFHFYCFFENPIVYTMCIKPNIPRPHPATVIPNRTLSIGPPLRCTGSPFLALKIYWMNNLLACIITLHILHFLHFQFFLLYFLPETFHSFATVSLVGPFCQCN